MSDESPKETTHTIVAGEHLFRIAKAEGFRTPKAIAEAPANKALLKQRVNPATLVVGDVVTIPKFEPKATAAPIDQFTKLTVAASGLFLNLVLQDTEQRPLAKRAYRLVVAENNPAGGFTAADPIDDVTTDKGEIQKEIPAFTVEGELVVHETDDLKSSEIAKIKVLVGVLESANTIRGQQARLNNMGYFAGFSEKDEPQLHWAIEEFQADHKLKVTGKFDDPDTQTKIAREHGDLLPSEKVS